VRESAREREREGERERETDINTLARHARRRKDTKTRGKKITCRRKRVTVVALAKARSCKRTGTMSSGKDGE
jgi:hypothetical protein